MANDASPTTRVAEHGPSDIDLPARLRREGCTCKGHLHKAEPGNVYCFATDRCGCELTFEARVRLGFEKPREQS